MTDEMYIPTMLALLGALQSIEQPFVGSSHNSSKDDIGKNDAAELVRVSKRRVTYCDWSKSDRSPETFTNLSAKLIEAAQREGCQFLRKVKLPPFQEKRDFPGSDTALDDGENRVKLEMLKDWMSLVLKLDPGLDSFVHYLHLANDIISTWGYVIEATDGSNSSYNQAAAFGDADDRREIHEQELKRRRKDDVGEMDSSGRGTNRKSSCA